MKLWFVCYYKYSSPASLPMDDLEKFAEYLGLKGIDSDLFYESYYGIDNEEYECSYELEEYYDCNS